MTPLEQFLRAVDLDELLAARQQFESITPEEESLVEKVIAEWADRQAVANLLFHPTTIPERMRFDAIDRALHSYDAPYLGLAAVVGLQGVDPDSVPESRRAEWRDALLTMIRSNVPVLACRASVTAFSWMREEPAALIAIHSTANENARQNILAFGLARFGSLERHEFEIRITECGASSNDVAAFNKHYDTFQSKKRDGEPGVDFLRRPVYCYIPNLEECETESSKVEQPKTRALDRGFFPHRFLLIQKELRPRVRLGLMALPVAMIFLSIAPLALSSMWLSKLLGLKTNIAASEQEHGALWANLFVVAMVVHMILGYLFGWLLNALVLRLKYGWSFARIRRLFTCAEVPEEWFRA